jgi:hypothetical protein
MKLGHFVLVTAIFSHMEFLILDSLLMLSQECNGCKIKISQSLNFLFWQSVQKRVLVQNMLV